MSENHIDLRDKLQEAKDAEFEAELDGLSPQQLEQKIWELLEKNNARSVKTARVVKAVDRAIERMRPGETYGDMRAREAQEKGAK